MQVKFTSNISKTSDAIFIISSNKSYLKETGIEKNILSEIYKAIDNKGFNFNKGEVIEINNFLHKKTKSIFVYGLGKKLSEVNYDDFQQIGGKVTQLNKSKKRKKVNILIDKKIKDDEKILRLGFGNILGSYTFNKYKTKNLDKNISPSIEIVNSNFSRLNKSFTRYDSIAEGIHFTRDLVNEPSNVLFPKEYSKRISKLRKYGLKVEILGETKMKSLKMDSLLGVGRGSQHESQLVLMRWDGTKVKKSKPICFVGKGVCFDSGGISIKPSNKMEEMIGDMGGSAAVVGTMLSLAKRKAKVNAIGVVGLVENMPDGKAQKPGDIVKSMSGQTIEIQNTDAEGRLVLADALWYTQKRFNPEVMIDLATLTGAMVISLGNLISGLFSNNDKLSDNLTKAGELSGDKVWRFPINDSYNKLINSRFADMKNIGMGGAGSITAAQFLERFVNKVPWAHIDIAGTATGMPKSTTNTSWASGFGVHLLDTFVKEFYEK
ncbi:MAG: leucyl aminopeptidase [Pseudomonadota bacterium]|nr:leucyl aminopeptidase [Pseudomonadota bacterium]